MQKIEWNAYLDTDNEYNSKDVVKAFNMALELGMKAMHENKDELHADIISDFIANRPIIERE